MAIKILDSWALMALFHEEPAADEVETLLSQALADRQKLLMSVVNWGEIYYSVMRGASQEMAEQKAREIAAMPIEIIPADMEQAHQAAIFKAAKKMSYADCFAAALARIRNAEFVTGDPEFKEVEKEIKINWLK
jgi:predicted nucleic acid-binding protein